MTQRFEPAAESDAQARPTHALLPTPQLDGVVGELGALVTECIAGESRLGDFAALYLRVTQEVRRAVRAGEFEDAARMDELDARFARRYLDALAARRAGTAPTQSWRVAFAAAERSAPIALQQLLLGMNAHINLDLGIAALQSTCGKPLVDLRADFDRINAILASLLETVQRALGRSLPLLYWIDAFAGRSDELLANFSIEVARDGAWRFAQSLAVLDPAQRAAAIAARDARIAALGRGIESPGGPLGAGLRALRWLEFGSPAAIIRQLLQ